MPLKTIILGNYSLKVKCKCGNFPKVGDKFWYASKYDNHEVEGIIKEVNGNAKITSTNNVQYMNSEISLVNLRKLREEKINEIFKSF